MVLRLANWGRLGRAGAAMLRWPLPAASTRFVSPPLVIPVNRAGFTVSVTHVHALAPAACNKEGSSARLSWPATLLGAVVGLCATTVAGLAHPFECAPRDPIDIEQEVGYKVPNAMREKYGRYLPWQRLNVDQVPLPFVNNMEQTYETRGSKRVNINQLGPSLGKRQATGQVCFRPYVPPEEYCTSTEARKHYKKYLMEQPAPCIVFRGKGNVSKAELDAYPEGLVVLWQDKAWVDRPVAVEWAEDVIEPFMEAEREAGVASADTRYLLFQDNLDSQKQPEYLNKLKNCGVDDHKLPPNETDQVQPIDRGFGRQVKIYLGEFMDEWLDDDDNLTKWEDNGLTASDRRILLANWYVRAVKRALVSDAKRKYFEHAGALLTADGSDDHLIKLEGTPEGYKLIIK